MSLIDDLRKKGEVRLRIEDYLRWVALVFLVALALVAAVAMVILLLAGDTAVKFVEHLAQHLYLHYGLIPVLVLLLIAAAAAVAFVVQLVMTYVVYRKAYVQKRPESAARGGDLLAKPGSKTGWTRGYYQGAVLLLTNALLAVLLVAGVVYALGYIGIEVAEQPEFCLMCHEVMKPSYDSYAASTHEGVHCGACHNDPGLKGFVKGEVIAPAKEGWLQVSGEYLDKDGGRVPMVVHMNNESCLHGECHKEKRLKGEEFHHGTLIFRHEKHLELKHGGHSLSCAACHTYDEKVHMKVNYDVCGLCHFSPLSKQQVALQEAVCEDCHAERVALKDELQELVHREAVDFKRQPCQKCHSLKRAGFAFAENACNQCKKKHRGEDKTPTGPGDHQGHEAVRCMLCHAKVPHREKISSEKFESAPVAVFGKELTHGGHADVDCTDCHGQKAGHFVLTLKNPGDCSACHHQDVDSADTCDMCHELKKLEAFGKKFKHEGHGDNCADCHDMKEKRFGLTLKGAADCSACHHEDVKSPDSCGVCHERVKLDAFGRRFKHEGHSADCKECHSGPPKDFTLTLKGRGDCAACHHEDADDPETCSACHDLAQEFFEGKGKFGIEETPSTKFAAEMGCDTCHEEVKKYQPGQTRAACANCHEEDEPEYSYDKLIQKNRASLETLRRALEDAQALLAATREKGVGRTLLTDAQKALAEAKAILDLMSRDGSFGLHNPGLFDEFAQKAHDLIKEARRALQKARRRRR